MDLYSKRELACLSITISVQPSCVEHTTPSGQEHARIPELPAFALQAVEHTFAASLHI